MSTGLVIACPHCLGKIDLVQHVQEQAWRELYLTLGQFGGSWGRVLAYLQLCRKSPSGRMPIKTMTKCARELAEIYRDQRFSYDRDEYRPSRDQVLASIEVVLDQKGHECPGFGNLNYLKKVMIQSVRAGRREAGREEARKNQARKEQAARRVPSQPERIAPEPEQPLWESPLEDVIESFVVAYRSPTARRALSAMLAKLEGRLEAEGVDLKKLKALAPDLPKDISGMGAALIKKCKPNNNGGMAPAAECLPKPGRDDE